GGQQVRVPVYPFGRGSVEQVDVPFAVAERPHATAATDSGRLFGGRLLASESLAFIRGAGDPDAPILLPLGARVGRVPGDEDVAGLVGTDRAAAVQTDCRVNYVAFALEGSALVVLAGVEHRCDLRLSLALARSHPGNVSTAVLTDRQMCAT